MVASLWYFNSETDKLRIRDYASYLCTSTFIENDWIFSVKDKLNWWVECAKGGKSGNAAIEINAVKKHIREAVGSLSSE